MTEKSKVATLIDFFVYITIIRMPEFIDAKKNIPRAVLQLIADEQVSQDFDIYGELQKRKGIFLEIGGPTLSRESIGRSYFLVDTKKLSKPLITSNITKGVTEWVFDYDAAMASTNDQEEDFYRPVDFHPANLVANATRLPIKDGSVGALFASGLPEELRKGIFQEAYRILEPGGIVVWQAATKKQLQTAAAIGFKLKSLVRDIGQGSSFPCIFQKPETS